MYIPIYIKEYFIYDIFHNDNNELIIIMPLEKDPLIIKYKNNLFTLHSCSSNHTYVYISNIKIEYIEIIELNINNKLITTKVNKYPEFKNEILFSTIVLNEDKYIRQWIKFHLDIGIDRFIIYDNATTSNLSELLNDYIKNNIVILIKWNYQYKFSKSGFSAQTTQQNHSIYAFQNSKYIGLFDIDEYINMQNDKNISIFFTNLIKSANVNINNIGSFKLLNKFFYNPHNLPTNNFNFLKIYNCDNITLYGHEKHFIIPKNVNLFSIHKIVKGKTTYNLDHKKIYFNHYYFLNKLTRGSNNTNIIDNSISKHIINL